MTFSHHVGADFAASEIARMLAKTPALCYAAGSIPSGGISGSASYESSASPWPKADGVISVLEPHGSVRRDIALEFKRQQEGIHGLLTAMGQAHGYVHKGYSGAAIIVPERYATHSTPAAYVAEVLDQISASKAIGVFSYSDPDTASATPFAGRIQCVRPLEINTSSSTARPSGTGPKTQWVHTREGSTTRDAFFRFLQTASSLSSNPGGAQPALHPDLSAAVARVAPGADPHQYLANVADAKPLSRVWQAFWFGWVATPSVLTPWVKRGSSYETPNAFTEIERDDGLGKSQLWEGRNSGLKEQLVRQLNAGSVSEAEAWEMFVRGIPAAPGGQGTQGVRHRAHSYREDLDSSLAHLGWIGEDGLPSDRGYKYMQLCERYGGANSRAAKDYVGATFLQIGRYASFLHYVYRLSEAKFSSDPFAFTERDARGDIVFNETSYANYLQYLEDEFVSTLKVMRKVTGRARPRRRTVFQAELTFLRTYGFVSKSRYRLGVGIPIDWENVHAALNYEL